MRSLINGNIYSTKFAILTTGQAKCGSPPAMLRIAKAGGEPMFLTGSFNCRKLGFRHWRYDARGEI